MERFKKGTKVVCLEYGQQTEALEKGKIYTVIGTKETYGVFVEGLTDWWFDHRFIPVSELEPFAVKFYSEDQFTELLDYASKCGLTEVYNSYFDLFVMLDTSINKYFTIDRPNCKTLTFEQFKNNEHLMNTQEANRIKQELSGCCTGEPKIQLLEVSPEFVKKAHRAACADWKKKIEKQFPSLFPKETYKIGDKLKIEDFTDATFLLAATGARECVLVCFEDGTHLNGVFSVDNSHKISEEELRKVVGNSRRIGKL